MKPQERVLVSEISKLQGIVSELKAGFSSALRELSQIQHGDTSLREELEEDRRSCEKKALHLEALLQSLRDELGEMRCQILQLCVRGQRCVSGQRGQLCVDGQRGQRCVDGQRAQRGVRVDQPAGDRGLNTVAKQRPSDSGTVTGRSLCECVSSPPASSSRGRALLHCYLHGLKAGVCERTDERHQLTTQLLRSEWEYVSILKQVYDKYKTASAPQTNLEPYQTYLAFVEQLLQRHLLFRNTLDERLSAEHWKCLVGDIFVQLIGHNESSFTDMYHGYTTTLAAFLSVELDRITLSEKTHSMQSAQVEREELKLLSLLLAPVSRIHSYLSHIQSLLQWTGREHPDHSLLLGSERALRNVLSRCHVTLEQDAHWAEGGEAGPSRGSCGSSRACVSSAAQCCSSSPLCPDRAAHTHRDAHTHREESSAHTHRDAHTHREESSAHTHREESSAHTHREESSAATQTEEPHRAHLSNGVSVCHAPRHAPPRQVCWSHSLPRRRSCLRDRPLQPPPGPAPSCAGPSHLDVSSLLRAADGGGWGETTSDSGQGTSSQAAGRGPDGLDTPPRTEDCETDPDDTSAFDYSSVTSCSPDGTLRRGGAGGSGEEEDEDSHVPVLLKPSSYPQQQSRETSPRERSVCVRWQIPRLTPHPPLRGPTVQQQQAEEGPAPGPPYATRVVSIRKGSPPLLPNRAFRPIWDEPFSQGDAAEEENSHGFVPIQEPERQVFPNYHQNRENRRSGMEQRAAVWTESEDSEGPCSTV